jgi:HSP20 family protein
MARYGTDPVDELRRMQERMSRLFEELPESIAPAPPSMENTQMPYVDVVDRDKDIVVTADLPGVNKNDIKINVRGEMLEISAERKAEHEQKDKGYVRHERRSDRFYRSIRLPVSVETDKAKACFNNGVLEITLPKAAKDETSHIPVS